MELKRRLDDAIANYLNVHGDCSRLNCSECRALRSDPPLYYPKRAIMPDDDLMDLSYFFAKRGE